MHSKTKCIFSPYFPVTHPSLAYQPNTDQSQPANQSIAQSLIHPSPINPTPVVTPAVTLLVPYVMPGSFVILLCVVLSSPACAIRRSYSRALCLAHTHVRYAWLILTCAVLSSYSSVLCLGNTHVRLAHLIIRCAELSSYSGALYEELDIAQLIAPGFHCDQKNAGNMSTKVGKILSNETQTAALSSR